MGKKGNNAAQKKAAKQQKTDNKQEKASKKAGKIFGNDDIDAILADFAEQDRKKNTVCHYAVDDIPSRVNGVFLSHPNTDTLIFHGGEHFNGNKVTCYKDMYTFNTSKNEYKHITSPQSPIRSGHQSVIINQDNNAYLYLFGGDFTSPSQLFKHYNDLWVCDLSTYKWEQILAPNGPSIRSGHRMVSVVHGGRRALYVFGGFYDNHQSIKYFNDLYKFELDTRKWEKLGPGVIDKKKMSAAELALINGQQWPSTRSGFGFTYHEATNSLLLYGGYCTQTKKNSLEESANVLSDLWSFSLQTNTWSQLKQTGYTPAGRSACQLFTYQNHILLFGGVKDVEKRIEKTHKKNDKKDQQVNNDDEPEGDGDDDEMNNNDDDGDDNNEIDINSSMTNAKKKKQHKKKSKKNDDEDEFVIESEFYNELLEYSMKHKRWFKLPLNIGQNPLIKEEKPLSPTTTTTTTPTPEITNPQDKKDAVAWNWSSSKQQEQKLKEQQRALAERRKQLEAEQEAALLAMNAIDTTTINNDDDDDDDKKKNKMTLVNYLWPRRNGMVTIKNGILYLYGGAFERENIEVILNDFHCLDLKKVFKNYEIDKEYAQQQAAQTTTTNKDNTPQQDEIVGNWMCITEADLSKFSWFEENDDNDDSDEEEEFDFSDDDDDEEEENGDSEANKGKLSTRVPTIDGFLTGKEYFKSCEEFWKSEALTEAPEGISDKDLRQIGFKLAKKYFEVMKKKQGDDE